MGVEACRDARPVPPCRVCLRWWIAQSLLVLYASKAATEMPRLENGGRGRQAGGRAEASQALQSLNYCTSTLQYRYSSIALYCAVLELARRESAERQKE